MKRLFYEIILGILLFAAFPSCEKVGSLDITGAPQVDEETLNAVSTITLRSPRSADGVVNVLVTEGAGFTTELIYATSNRPASFGQVVSLSVDSTLVESYNKKSSIAYQLLPEPFYKFENGKILTIGQNENESDYGLIKFYATNSVGNTLETGHYLLPIVAEASSEKVSGIFYYEVEVRKHFDGNADLYTGDDGFFVFYVNTNTYDPRLVTDYMLQKENFDGIQWYCTVGNIVNLRTVTLIPDEKTGKAVLNLGTDIRYVLDHSSKYILPLKEEGRKVCLCIEGANKGVGFCNLTDEQIVDFSLQVKQVLDYYGLDGINLWDRNSGYDLPGATPTNTTSYPKLIKSLREVLGSDKLLTLTDYEAPTEYFWNTEATGGIQVGEYIDYAWSGYNEGSEGYQIVDPYNQDAAMVSKLHPRKPIAGLSPEKYGCINAPWRGRMSRSVYNSTGRDIVKWVGAGYNANKIILHEDCRTQLQDNLESGWGIEEIIVRLNPGYIYLFDHSLLSTIEFADGTIGGGYNKWLKDW